MMLVHILVIKSVDSILNSFTNVTLKFNNSYIPTFVISKILFKLIILNISLLNNMMLWLKSQPYHLFYLYGAAATFKLCFYLEKHLNMK